MKRDLRRKKLNASDISKNSSIEVSHTIKKIKENEKKYTIMLVIFFMILFCLIGYFTLSFNAVYIDNYDYDALSNNQDVSSSGTLISLYGNDQVEDSIALNDDKYTYTYSFSNNSKEEIKYQIVLEKDSSQIDKCGCSNSLLSYDSINYSINGKDVNTFSNDNLIIDSGVLDGEAKETLNIKLWVNSKGINNEHFHGHITLEKVK
jgi:hypothetical protein